MGSDEIDYDEVADKVLDRLDTGQAIGDKIILSRRQLVALAAGGLSVGALTTLGVDEATAQQAVGQVGTDSERVDVFANIVDANEITAPNELDGNDLTDDGTTVYQAGSDTVGDGTTSADHESIKAGDLAVETDGSAGTTDDILKLESATGDADAQDRQEVTEAVSTTATEILPFDSNQNHSIVLVQGVKDDNNMVLFWDLLHATLNRASTVNQDGISSPDTRTYTTTQSGSEYVLELEMGGNSYDVIARAVESGGLTSL